MVKFDPTQPAPQTPFGFVFDSPGHVIEVRVDEPTEPGPQIVVEFRIGHSDSTSGYVFFQLYDTGHRDDNDRILFDVDLTTSNDDNLDPFSSANMVMFATYEFFRRGYGEQFGDLIGL